MSSRISQPVAASKLLVCITAAYRPRRLVYLYETLRCLAEYLVAGVHVILVTDTALEHELENMRAFVAPLTQDRLTVEIVSVEKTADVFEMTWAHKRFIPERFLAPGSDYTHFVYLEEDIRFSFANFSFFCEFREILRPHDLLPSFIRYEYNTQHNRLFLTDITDRNDMNRKAVIRFRDLLFVNPSMPYMAMYILDRELAVEHVNSPSFDIEGSKHWGMYNTAERATMALTWEHFPGNRGFVSRYVVPIHEASLTPHYFCLVHHSPNNYTHNWELPTQCGTLRLDDCFVRAAE